MTQPDPAEISRLSRKLLIAFILHTIPGVPPLIYLMGVVSGLDLHQGLTLSLVFVPLAHSVVGVAWPYLAIRSTLRGAFEDRPGEPRGARLGRLLEAPRVVELHLQMATTVGGVAFGVATMLVYDKTAWTIVWAGLIILLVILLLTLPVRVAFERILRPYAIAEFHRNPESAPRGEGILWPRQRWFLPYAFAIFVANSLMMVLSIIARKAYDFYALLPSLSSGVGSRAELVESLQAIVVQSARGALLPLICVGTYLLLSAAFSAWRMAQNQSEGSKAVQDAMEALASGSPRLPEWVTTDEIGDLSVATAKAFSQLSAFSLSLGESAEALRSSAEQLGTSTSRQSDVITLQATALQETQVTADEIKQISLLASQKADNVLEQTERADKISRAGEAAVQQSLGGMQAVGDQVQEIAKTITALAHRARQIGDITSTVKDLADQSNMLALNAAIEAVRSGEHGKGFGVVAREIRALADQSIQATNSVREILADITGAITNSVSITEKGSERIQSSLAQLRDFSTNMQALSGIVRENASSVRQITAAVSQQNTGIGQIFQAVNDLSKMMEQTVVQLRASDEALVLVRKVAEKVSFFVDSYKWKKMDGGEKAAPGPAAASRVERRAS